MHLLKIWECKSVVTEMIFGILGDTNFNLAELDILKIFKSNNIHAKGWRKKSSLTN